MRKPRVAYVTYVSDPADPDVDIDLDLFIGALSARGIDVHPCVWNDRGVDWASYDLTLVRSPWDYARQRERFLLWARSVSAVTRLVNPYEVLEENTDKKYLERLSASGIPVIPTLYLEGPRDLPEAFPGAAAGWVVKPTVDAGARGASRHFEWSSVAEKVRAHFAQSPTSLMVQPYLTEVDTVGEIAVVCCCGEIVHAIIKKPALSAGGHGDFAGNAQLTAPLRDFVGKVLALQAARGTYADLLYARVDVVPREGGYLLMELEATEPCLFLAMADGAADVFADAVAEMLE
jgi:glutathione synthase/RimK-type ligase-like ATP-grasp enzyme